MIEYADSATCLRATSFAISATPPREIRARSCGNCRPGAIDALRTRVVRKDPDRHRAGGRTLRPAQIVAMLVGDTSDLPPALAGLSTTGLLRQESPETLDRWIDAATAAGLIAVSSDKYRTLSLTTLGRDVMTGRTEDLRVTPPIRVPGLSSWRRLRKHRPTAYGRGRLDDEW